MFFWELLQLPTKNELRVPVAMVDVAQKEADDEMLVRHVELSLPELPPLWLGRR